MKKAQYITSEYIKTNRQFHYNDEFLNDILDTDLSCEGQLVNSMFFSKDGKNKGKYKRKKEKRREKMKKKAEEERKYVINQDKIRKKAQPIQSIKKEVNKEKDMKTLQDLSVRVKSSSPSSPSPSAPQRKTTTGQDKHLDALSEMLFKNITQSSTRLRNKLTQQNIDMQEVDFTPIKSSSGNPDDVGSGIGMGNLSTTPIQAIDKNKNFNNKINNKNSNKKYVKNKGSSGNKSKASPALAQNAGEQDVMQSIFNRRK